MFNRASLVWRVKSLSMEIFVVLKRRRKKPRRRANFVKSHFGGMLATDVRRNPESQNLSHRRLLSNHEFPSRRCLLLSSLLFFCQISVSCSHEEDGPLLIHPSCIMTNPGDLSLECGASLSEQAHGAQNVPARRKESSTTEPTEDAKPSHPHNTVDDLRRAIARDVLTDSTSTELTTFTSPLELDGTPVELPLVYCDQTASNRPLSSIENYLQKE